MNQPNAIVCLVGENPLPVYLGARQFANQQCHIVLVHSSETDLQAVRLKDQLKAEGYENVSKVKLQDPSSASSVSKLIDSIHKQHPNAWLNYTGGTKVMSAFSVKQWANDECVFYLDEGSGSFRFGNGRDEELGKGIVNTTVLCNLHGVMVESSALQDFERHIDGELLGKLFGKWPKSNHRYRQERSLFMPSEWTELDNKDPMADITKRWEEFKSISGLFDEINAPKSPAELKGKFKYQYKFAATAWQELLVLRMIQKCDYNEFLKNKNFRIANEQFETDVLGVLNNRLYYLSCTTSPREKLVKAKAFEAMYRARQIGGGMARVAVVSFASNDELGKVIQSLTGVPRLQVFGISDVESWLYDQYDTLQNFLMS